MQILRQRETLEEARINLEEAIELVLESNRLLTEEQLQGEDSFIGMWRDRENLADSGGCVMCDKMSIHNAENP